MFIVYQILTFVVPDCIIFWGEFDPLLPDYRVVVVSQEQIVTLDWKVLSNRVTISVWVAIQEMKCTYISYLSKYEYLIRKGKSRKRSKMVRFDEEHIGTLMDILGYYSNNRWCILNMHPIWPMHKIWTLRSPRREPSFKSSLFFGDIFEPGNWQYALRIENERFPKIILLNQIVVYTASRR